MVFHVTGIIESCLKLTFCSGLNALNFGHDNFNGLSDDVSKHVESTTVRHTNHE